MDSTSIQTIRVQLRKQMRDLTAPDATRGTDDWNAVGREHQRLMLQLRHTYHSRLGWWWIRAREWATELCHIGTFRRRQAFHTQPCSPASTLVLALGERIQASSHTAGRVELTADAMAAWLDDDVIRQVGRDAAGCLRILHQSLQGEFTALFTGAGRVWFEADGPDRVLVYVER